MNCEICGKPRTQYPNWIISKGYAMHVGCMAQQFDELRKTVAFLADRCIASGGYGPWCDNWVESFCGKHWEEIDTWK